MDVYVVLLDVATDWPEVVFVGTWEEARRLADSVRDDVGVSVQAVVSLEDALKERESQHAQ